MNPHYLYSLKCLDECIKHNEIYGGEILKYELTWYTNQRFFTKLKRILLFSSFVKDQILIDTIDIFIQTLEDYIKNNYVEFNYYVL